jgi:hypothetical protein
MEFEPSVQRYLGVCAPLDPHTRKATGEWDVLLNLFYFYFFLPEIFSQTEEPFPAL